MYVDLDRYQSDLIGGVDLPLHSLATEGQEALEIIKIWIFTYMRPFQI